MAQSATGVMDKPAKTKATKTTKSTTTAKKKTQSTTRRRSRASVKETPAKETPEKPAPDAEQPSDQSVATATEASPETEAAPETAANSETRTNTLGARGEEAAARFLYRRGYEILDRNWKCFAGEVDIVAKDDDTLVFVEVKTRKDGERGFPSEVVTAEKRARYEKIALAYLSECESTDFPVRFDIVSLVVIAPDKAAVRHQINAFSAA